jgi:hypothetical protein
MTDIRSLRVAWTAGYTFVGDGTNGIADSVYFQTVTGTYLMAGLTAGVSGFVPVVSGDTQLGATYLSDIEKHFARKIIKRMWIHLDSLQPSTSNNMMCVVGIARGGSGTEAAQGNVLATATTPANTVTNVLSMKGSFPVDSWESKSCEITDFIAGGSGARQNEFQVGSTTASGTIVVAGSTSGFDGIGTVPSCFAIAGNSTTSGLRNTRVHQVVIEQELDLLDYVGGMAVVNPVG